MVNPNQKFLTAWENFEWNPIESDRRDSNPLGGIFHLIGVGLRLHRADPNPVDKSRQNTTNIGILKARARCRDCENATFVAFCSLLSTHGAMNRVFIV